MKQIRQPSQRPDDVVFEVQGSFGLREVCLAEAVVEQVRRSCNIIHKHTKKLSSKIFFLTKFYCCPIMSIVAMLMNDGDELVTITITKRRELIIIATIKLV